MRTIARAISAAGLVLMLAFGSAAHEQPLTVVAAENVYGDIARQIGGPLVDVVSLINKPNQDPHFFEMTSTALRLVSAAQIVVYNGANYDPWVNKLLSATRRTGRISIDVAELAGTKSGDNPHLWYSLPAVRSLGKAIAGALSALDPANVADYAARQQAFEKSLVGIENRIDHIRARHAGIAIAATEPVFGYMAAALGLEMRNERFQLAVMNGTEPAARDIAAFEQDLKEGKVKALLFNKQASTELTQRMLEAARRAKIPVVGVTELQPPGSRYQDWMVLQLDELQKALIGPSQ
jgi:zinc/manganese transport system substrate-binding protein